MHFSPRIGLQYRCPILSRKWCVGAKCNHVFAAPLLFVPLWSLMLRICCCPRKRERSFYSPSDISRSDWWIFFLVEVDTTLWLVKVEFHRKIILWWFLKYFWLLRLSFLFCKILPLAFYQKKTAALKTDLWNTKESKKSPKTVIDAIYNDKNVMFFS